MADLDLERADPLCESRTGRGDPSFSDQSALETQTVSTVVDKAQAVQYIHKENTVVQREVVLGLAIVAYSNTARPTNSHLSR